MSKNKIKYNFHQHSIFSDGSASPEKYVEKALEKEFTAIGFSEHSPLPFDNDFSLKENKIKDYVEDIDKLKEFYNGKIAVYRSLELDFIPGISDDFEKWKKTCKTEYSIGGVHLVKPENSSINDIWFIDGPDRNIYDNGLYEYFGGDIKKAVKTYFYQLNEMIVSNDFDIIAHFDKIKMHNQNRFFTEDEKWYINLVDETLTLIKEKDIIVEVNTRGVYKKRSNDFFPDGTSLQKVIKMNIPLIVSADAHKPDEIDMLLEKASERIVMLGGKSIMYFYKGEWKEQPLV